MATSPLPILLGVGALLLLKSKGKDAPAAAAAGTATTETDGGGGAAAGTGNGSGGAGTGTTATGSSGYKNVSAAMMKAIQVQLGLLGYNPGAANGHWIFGGSTYKAVKAFQGDNNLEDDGKPGPITRAKLNEVTASNSDDSSEGDSTPGNGGNGGGGGVPEPDEEEGFKCENYLYSVGNGPGYCIETRKSTWPGNSIPWYILIKNADGAILYSRQSDAGFATEAQALHHAYSAIQEWADLGNAPSPSAPDLGPGAWDDYHPYD